MEFTQPRTYARWNEALQVSNVWKEVHTERELEKASEDSLVQQNSLS